MKYSFELEGEPKRAPRVAIHGKATIRTNLHLLGKLAKSKMTDVKEIQQAEDLIANILRGMNEL